MVMILKSTWQSSDRVSLVITSSTVPNLATLPS